MQIQYKILTIFTSGDSNKTKIVLDWILIIEYVPFAIWQYELWSFQMGGTKLERFLPKNQLTQRKLLNFLILRIGLMASCRKLGIILVIKAFKN